MGLPQIKFINKIQNAYQNGMQKLYWWNVKRTCKHPITIETFRDYQDRYGIEICTTCNKEFEFDL